MKIKNKTIDLIAISSSLICAVHCAAIPIILSFSSLSSLNFLTNTFIEWSFIGLGVLFAIVSLWPSYKKVHQKITPLLWAFIGFLFIGLGRFNFSELFEIGNTVVGASLVSVSHYFNWKLLKNKEHYTH